MRREKQIFPPNLKVPGQRHLVLLLEVVLRQGKSLGSEKVKFWFVDFVTSR
jgi:hypothetical protein